MHVSFPVIDSPYCWKKANKTYLEADLNIEKMYDLYKGKCLTEGISYVKSSYYWFLFNTNFNIAFHAPETDRFEKCEEIKVWKDMKR